MDSEQQPTETDEDTDGDAADDESPLDRMRGSGAGVEDPHIVGRTEPGIVEEHVQEDEPPQV